MTFKPWKYVASLGVSAVHPPVQAILGKRYVRKFHDAGLLVRPWIVNSPRQLAVLVRGAP